MASAAATRPPAAAAAAAAAAVDVPHEQLLKDLSTLPESKARTELLTRAKAFEFHSVKSPVKWKLPEVELVNALKTAGFADLQRKAELGEYVTEDTDDAGDNWELRFSKPRGGGNRPRRATRGGRLAHG